MTIKDNSILKDELFQGSLKHVISGSELINRKRSLGLPDDLIFTLMVTAGITVDLPNESLVVALALAEMTIADLQLKVKELEQREISTIA